MSFYIQMGGTENIKYYQNYQVNLLNQVTRLNFPVIGESNLSVHSRTSDQVKESAKEN